MGNLRKQITIEEQRQRFLGIENKSYFNFGGQGILPKAALEQIVETHQYIQTKGPFSVQVNNWLQTKTALLRKAIAQELKTTPDRITLTENVTAGCNIAFWGRNWQPGEIILLSDCEHPGIIATAREIARRFGVLVQFFPLLETLNQGDPLETIQQHLTPQTRLLVVSHLLWNTGQVLPLTEIVTACHQYPQAQEPIRVLVDAAQSVGCLDLDLPATGVDYYAFTGHKWLCGPAGVGGLYVSEDAFAELHPTFIGWRGVDTDSQGQPESWKPDGQRFEVATSAYPEYQGLATAIAIHQEWGTPSTRYQRIRQLSQYLWFSLSQIDGVECLKKSPPEAGLVSFKLSGKDHTSLVNQLEKQGFFLRTISYPSCVRACVHYLSLTQEIDSLVAAISLAMSQS